MKFSYNQNDEHEEARETHVQRGDDRSQKASLLVDERLRMMILDSKKKIPNGPYRTSFARANEGLWYFGIWDDKREKVLNLEPVGYDTKYIEITKDPSDYIIEAKTEVPAAVNEAMFPTPPPPPCPRCLPIEDLSNEALGKLVETKIHVNGRQYCMVGRDGRWTTQNHESFILAPRCYIGTRNPFILFKLGQKSLTWFEEHNAAKKNELLQRLRDYGESGPGFDLGKHLQLVNSPASTESPFRLDGKPIQIVGSCPRCHKTPNPHAV